MSPAFLRTAACALGLAVALATSAAHAVDLYQWIDSDGVASIGPNPPLGVSAVPYTPGKPAAPAAPASLAEVPPAVPGSAQRPMTANGPTETPCAVYTNAAREATSELADAEREIARLEAKLEALDASDLAFARTECVSRDGGGPDPNCRASTFDRDKEIARSEKALDAAREALDDADAHVHDAAIPSRCQPASAE